jgi:hypothetical protein
MSCDGNRHHFFEQAAQPGSSLETTFGSQAAAREALEQIFQLARSRAQTKNAVFRRHAEAQTRALFAHMKTMGIKPPTHSQSGLPRPDAQFGYAAIYQTLEATKKGTSLPATARDILTQRNQTRRLSAVDYDLGGYLRCSNCGRFASASRGHICPMTTTAEKLNRSLQRRLGISPTAFDPDDLDNLLLTAQSDDVTMTHHMTGEQIFVSLDGLAVAMAQGYQPDHWTGQFHQIELPDGRIVTVRNPEDFPIVTPSGAALVDTAAAYGVVLAPGFGVGTAAFLPVLPVQTIAEEASTTVSGGQDYDQGHFMGTEYRKKSALGSDVEACGVTYTIGSRSPDNVDWSTARIMGYEPPPRGGVAVGRTLVKAVDLLSNGTVVETSDGQIQLYDGDQDKLLAVYDPNANTAADMDGSTNASPAQMAAIVAHRVMHPQDRFDVALATDLVRAQSGVGTPLAAADSAYIVMKNSVLSSGKSLKLGGQIGTVRCPQCGQFGGDGHRCPQRSLEPKITTTSTTPQPVTGNIDFAGIGAEIAAALQDNVPPVKVEVNLDPRPFAAAIREGLATLSPAANQATQTTDLSELSTAMAAMALAVESLANQPTPAFTRKDIAGGDSFAAAVDRLSGAIQGMPGGTPAHLVQTGNGQKRCSQCGQYAGEGHTCPQRQPRSGRPRPADLPTTVQEHVFASVTLPAPDPYLLAVPKNVGGDLYEPIEEFIPDLDLNYEVNAETEKILRSISAMLQAGDGKAGRGWSRAFGLYGPPGTGKNTLARQLAAAIQTIDSDGNITPGMNYVEANITPESSMQELIGTTVLETDPETGNTISRAKLGKLGLAAAMGSVICVNEIVRNPKLATALQSMLEDGEIQIDSPEQGLIRIPVHPATVFFATWNPGNEGDPDRPAAAPLSRMIPFRMSRPSVEEQASRARAFIANLHGSKNTSSGESRRKEIIQEDYKIPKDWAPSQDEVMAATQFVNEVALLAEGGIGERQIGLNSDTTTAPGPRQLTRFLMLGKTVGWVQALDSLKITCDQDSMFADQWRMVQERFEAHFGRDGQAVTRRQPGQTATAS